jgi:tRNA pseudouridine55 synthase
MRRLAGQKRVGHAGTLDPLAEGVLPVLLGRATRLADFIQLGHKTYVAEISLGTSTDTDDAEGEVIGRQPVPPLSRPDLEVVLAGFTGEILQTPPRYSALKVGGRRAYALARSGEDVELAARPVTIHAVRLLETSDTALRIEVACSKGTYIRALARDIAQALGTVGHLSSLVRTRVGPFALEDALTPAEIANRGVPDTIQPADHAMPDVPRHTLSDDGALRFLNGQSLSGVALRAEYVWVYDPHARLIGLATADGALLRPRFAL